MLYYDTGTTGKAYFTIGTSVPTATSYGSTVLSGTNGTYTTAHTVTGTVTVQPNYYLIIFNQVNSDSNYTALEVTS